MVGTLIRGKLGGEGITSQRGREEKKTSYVERIPISGISFLYSLTYNIFLCKLRPLAPKTHPPLSPEVICAFPMARSVFSSPENPCFKRCYGAPKVFHSGPACISPQGLMVKAPNHLTQSDSKGGTHLPWMIPVFHLGALPKK